MKKKLHTTENINFAATKSNHKISFVNIF